MTARGKFSKFAKYRSYVKGEITDRILFLPRVRRDYRRRETTVIQGERIAIEDLLLIVASNS